MNVNEETTRVSPSQGGCWYCKTRGGDMMFSCEFDTHLHLACVPLNNDPNDRESAIIRQEFADYFIPK